MSDGTDTLLPESAASGTGYQKCADGTLIQWGNVQITISAADTVVEESVTFPLAFIDGEHADFANPLAAASSTIQCQVVKRNSTSLTINIKRSTATDTWVSWLAIGRWK